MLAIPRIGVEWAEQLLLEKWKKGVVSAFAVSNDGIYKGKKRALV